MNEFRTAMTAYLYVPPGYERNWRQHCGQYHAGDQPVHFVRSKCHQGAYFSSGRGRNRGRDQH